MIGERRSDEMLSMIEDARSRFIDALANLAKAATELVEYYGAVIAEVLSQRQDTSEAARSDDWWHSPIPINCDDKMRAEVQDRIRRCIERTAPESWE